jgi:hypothetical protein
MDELRIVGWTNFECEYPTRNVEGPALLEIVQLIGDEVVKYGYAFSGYDHQNASTGVPVFSDGTCLRASMRGWGQIMAAIYSAVDEVELSYMDFYMSSYKETVLPEFKSIDVEAMIEEERPGMILQEDIELISSAVQMGMELMTLDKVIKRFVELILKEQEANKE